MMVMGCICYGCIWFGVEVGVYYVARSVGRLCCGLVSGRHKSMIREVCC
jgi:hypothetical protein